MEEVFAGLRAVMAVPARALDVTMDDPGHYSVDTFHTMKNGNRLWFGAVRLNKNYVSYHLMPVYVTPALLDDVSAPLIKRMQGKSCFNFKIVDDRLFGELAELSLRGLQDYQAQGFVAVRAAE